MSAVRKHLPWRISGDRQAEDRALLPRPLLSGSPNLIGLAHATCLESCRRNVRFLGYPKQRYRCIPARPLPEASRFNTACFARWPFSRSRKTLAPRLCCRLASTEGDGWEVALHCAATSGTTKKDNIAKERTPPIVPLGRRAPTRCSENGPHRSAAATEREGTRCKPSCALPPYRPWPQPSRPALHCLPHDASATPNAPQPSVMSCPAVPSQGPGRAPGVTLSHSG